MAVRVWDWCLAKCGYGSEDDDLRTPSHKDRSEILCPKRQSQKGFRVQGLGLRGLGVQGLGNRKNHERTGAGIHRSF